MDEAEKYQQRLQAIAEKRRQQEEEDRAKRELEDQKLRVQQLKRKSLRDQWLMEGPPTSPDSPGPNSPVLSSPTEEGEAQVDKLQESQQTAEEKADEPKEQDTNKAEEVKEDGGSAEEPPPASLENGQQEPSEDVVDSGAATSDNGLKSLQAAGEPETQPTPEEVGPVLNAGAGSEAGPETKETAVVPNGTQEDKEEAGAVSASAPPQQEEVAKPDAPQSATTQDGEGEEEGGSEGKLGEDPAPLPPASEVEPGKNLEEEDAGEVIRAERVIVTDEGDEPANTENVAPQDDTKEPTSPPESSASPPESSAPPPESSASPPESSAPPPESSASVEVPMPEVPKPDSADGAEGVQDSVKEPEKEVLKDEGESEAGAETQTGAEGNAEEAPESEAEPPADSAETGGLASEVPVYPAELPSLGPLPEAEGEGAKPEMKEKAPAPAVPAGQFQDIPLDGNAKPEAAKEPLALTDATETPADPSEQLALLDPSKVAPTRAEGAETPKRKTCQCCSVM